MPPALTNAVVAFGQELIGSASANYAPEYAHSVNQLLLTVAELASGAPFTQGQTGQYGGYANNPYGGYNSGYNTPSYDSAGNQTYGGTQPQYPSTAATYPGTSDGSGYPQNTYPSTQYPNTPAYPGTTQYSDLSQYPNTAQ